MGQEIQQFVTAANGDETLSATSAPITLRTDLNRRADDMTLLLYEVSAAAGNVMGTLAFDAQDLSAGASAIYSPIPNGDLADYASGAGLKLSAAFTHLKVNVTGGHLKMRILKNKL